MRKFILAVALMLGVVFLMTRFAEVQSIVETLQRGAMRYIFAAILVLILWYINVGASYKFIYQCLGMDESLRRLFMLAISAFFMNVVAPVAGMSGIALFVSDGNRRNLSPAKVTLATALFVLFDYLGFLVILTLGLAVLARRNKLAWPEVSASVILVSIALFLTALFYLGARSSKTLGNVLAYLGRFVNKVARPFIHREYLSVDRAYSFAEEASEGFAMMRIQPTKWIKPTLLALSNKALLIIILMLTFLAFKVPFTAGTIIAGFSIGYLFIIVSPTPSGIGVVEGILALTLSSLYVPLGAATVIVVAYRGITFWLPLLGGMVAFRLLSTHAPLKDDAVQ